MKSRKRMKEFTGRSVNRPISLRKSKHIFATQLFWESWGELLIIRLARNYWGSSRKLLFCNTVHMYIKGVNLKNIPEEISVSHPFRPASFNLCSELCTINFALVLPSPSPRVCTPSQSYAYVTIKFSQLDRFTKICHPWCFTGTLCTLGLCY